MKKMLKWSAIFAIAAATIFACTKPEPDPTPDPTPGPEVKAPVADFDYVADGLTVTFTNKSTDATSYKWEFGDSETSKDASPVHEYAAAGEYTVTLTAANSKGETNKKEVKINVVGKVGAYFSAVVAEGRKGEFGKGIEFDATASASAVSIVWDFGDGESSTDFRPFHIFKDFGKHTVKITVTGIAGDTAEYSDEVECVKNTELIKGGSLEADDAQFWTVAPFWGYDDGQYVDVEGVYAYAPHFGWTEPGFGVGGCYKFESNPLGWDYNNKGAFYQAFEVREGDVIDVDCLVQWGAEVFDNGHFSLRYSFDEFVCDGESEEGLLFWFNNWWGVHDPNPEDPEDERYTVWAPAYSGHGFVGDEEQADYGFWPIEGVTEVVDGKLRFTAPQSGMMHLIFFVDQVWGYAFGPGRDVFVDEISVNAVIE